MDRLTPTQVRRLRLLVTQDEELSQVTETLSSGETDNEDAVPDSLLALVGSVSSGYGDLAEHHDHYIRQRLRRHPPSS